jgi:hypothetical protein
MKSEKPTFSTTFTAETTAGLDLTEFQPKPGYLLTLLERTKEAGISALLLRWGELFPWTVDTRFCSASAYPEEIFTGFLREAGKKNIEVIPWAPLLVDSNFITYFPCYAYICSAYICSAYMKKECKALTVFSLLEKRCIPLFEDMVEDIVSLLPSLTYIAVPIFEGDLDKKKTVEEAAGRVKTILEQFSCNPLFVYFSTSAGQQDGDKIGPVAKHGATLQLDPQEHEKKLTIFENKQRIEIEKVTGKVERGWKIVQRTREYLIRMGIDCIERYKFSRIIREEEQELSQIIHDFEAMKQSFFAALLPSFEDVSVRRWFFSKTMPLKEEYAHIAARAAQLHPAETENNNL